MNYLRPLLIIAILFVYSFSIGQNGDKVLDRLQAISNYSIDFFNVDGFEITSQTIENSFTKKNIRKKFKRYRIKETDLTLSDSLIKSENFYFVKNDTTEGLIQYSSYYFIKTNENEITAFTFASINKYSKEFERNFVSLVINKKIPKNLYASQIVDSINFDGRKIHIGSSCNWMGVNNVQCPYYGQMDWSVHENLKDAKQTINNRLKLLKLQNNKGKIVSEEFVDVIFEGSNIKVKKAVFDFTGVTSVLVGMTGGKTLTIYLIAGAGSKNFISCVMSFWNNDAINPSGLPPLLEKIITLK